MLSLEKMSIVALLWFMLVGVGMTAPAYGQKVLQPGPLKGESTKIDSWFAKASAEFDVPVSILQAIGYAESRWKQIIPDGDHAEGEEVEPATHHGPPPAYGVMGLRDDALFGYSLRNAAALIGRTPDELKESAQLNIRGAAALLHYHSGGATRATPLELWEPAVAIYSGISDREIAEMYTYEVFNAIRSGRASENYRIRQKEVQLEKLYGSERLSLLSAPRRTINVPKSTYSPLSIQSTDYGPALWNPAPSCNYTAGRTMAVTHVTIHTIQGSYTSAINWFKNCDSNVSAHYVIRSSDGQITQMVREADKAYHVGTSNGYTVGIEHEGYVSDPGTWYTDAMYNASALLSRDILDSRGLARKVFNGLPYWNSKPADSEYNVKGHVNYANQSHTDPGSGWNWPRYRDLVNPPSTAWETIVDNATSGRFSASSNWATSSYSSQRYGADYRYANPQAISDAAWFSANIPSAGNYQIYVWYPANSGYNSATPFVVSTSTGSQTVSVNQQINGGAWVSLGTFNLNAGDYNVVGVSRWTSTAGYVIADAVKIVRR
jgi:N-acetyl-anhydromuramyl-L-alanine amidase AmpD